MKIKQNDTAEIISGKDRGKRGKVEAINRGKNVVRVTGINLRKKAIKKTEKSPGRFEEFTAPVHASNVMIVCPKCEKPSRLGFVKNEKGKKVRECKKCSAKF